MGRSSLEIDCREGVAPSIKSFKLLISGHGEIFGKLDFLGGFVFTNHLVLSLRSDLSSVENSREHSSQQVTLSSRESRVRLYTCIKVTSQKLLNLSGSDNVVRLDIGKLDPVVQNVIGYPENHAVAANSTRLSKAVERVVVPFLNVLSFQFSTCNPVVLLRAHNFTSKSELGCTTQTGKFLQRVLHCVSVLGSKIDSSPLE